MHPSGAAADVLAVKFDGYGNTFDMRLEHTTKPFAADFHLDVVDEKGNVETVNIVDLNFVYRGRLVGQGTEGSDVRAQITEKGLTATVTVQGELYSIEPIGKTNYSHGPSPDDHDGRYNHLITSHRFAEKHPLEHAQCGAKDHAHGGHTGHSYTQDANTDEQDATSTTGAQRRRRQAPMDFKVQNTCKMSLVADQHFYKNEGAEDQTKNKLNQTVIFVSASVACVAAVAQIQRSGTLAWSASHAMVARSPLIPLPALLTYRLCALVFTTAVSLSYTMSPYVTISWENLSGSRTIRD